MRPRRCRRFGGNGSSAQDDRRIQFLETIIGVTAATLTSLSYIPQAKKVQAGQPTGDLSSRTLIALTSGLVLWVVYGAVKTDWIIIAANIVGTSLTGMCSIISCGSGRGRAGRR